MRRNVLDTGVAAANGFTVTIEGLSEDLDAGVASVANRGAIRLHVEGPDGVIVDLELPGAEAENLVRPVVAGAVEHETEADIARRYLRDHAHNMYPHQVESLKKQAGLPYDEELLAAMGG